MMQRAKFSVAVAAIAAMVLAPISAAGQTVGLTTAVRNKVEIRQTKETQAKPAVVKQRVSLGNLVNTGGNSSLQVTLLDKSTFTVGPNAEFTINRFVYDPARQRSSVGSSVAKGTFRMLSGKAARGGANSITTPAATIGIRGTMIEGSIGVDAIAVAGGEPGFGGAGGADPATATLIVLRGPGPKAQAGEKPGAIEVTAGGRSVLLTRPGQAVFIPFAGAAPIGPIDLSTRGFAFFDSILRTAPSSFLGTLAGLQPLTSGAAGTGGNSGAGSGSAGMADGAGGGSSGMGGSAAGAGAGSGAGLGSTLSIGLLGLASLVTTLLVVSDNGRPASA